MSRHASFGSALRAAMLASFLVATAVPGARAQVNQVFHPYRPANALAHRDLEFHWSDSYRVARGGGLPVTPDEARTLDRLAESLCQQYSNPFNASMSDVELVFNYLFPFGGTYSRDPLQVGFHQPVFETAYLPSIPTATDTTHLDIYIYAPGDSIWNGWIGRYDHPTYGQFRSSFTSDFEDTSSGRPADRYQAWTNNAIMYPGPAPAASIDTTGTGWTRGDRGANAGIVHEYTHSLTPGFMWLPDGLGGINVYDNGTGVNGVNEIFSSAAEQIAGQNSPADANEVPYTWPLLSDNLAAGGNGCQNVWTPTVNYQNWRSFASYLLYGFRGPDTTATLQGFRDDLFYKWAHATPTTYVPVLANEGEYGVFYNRTLEYLRRLLVDDSCATCASKTYFHPGGQSLSSLDRLGVLLHNWRAANFVNAPEGFAEGQYGFAPQSHFSPSLTVNAWHSTDGCAHDDAISIPPNVTMTRTGAGRQRLYSKSRPIALSGGDNTNYPLYLYLTGAEYWTVRSDATLSTGGPYTLNVRVSADSTWKRRNTARLGTPDSLEQYTELRLVASVVGYTNAAPTDSLWKHPEWAAYASQPQWVDLDSLEKSLVLSLPNFGTTYKAALVVITAATGRDGEPSFEPIDSWYTQYTNKYVPYRLQLAITSGTGLPAEPTPVATDAAAAETAPSWSPSNADLAYVRTASGGVPQVYRKPVSGGSAVQVFATAEEQHDPDWSPRGDVIVFARGNTTAYSPATELWLAALNGTANAITNDGGWKRSPVFNHNGRTIAYAARFTYAMPQGGQEQRWGVWTIGVDGSTRTQVVQSAFGNPITAVRWSPDGNSIWFNSADSIYVVTPSTGAVVNRTGRLPVGVQSFDHPRSGGPIAIEQPGSLLWIYRGTLKLAENYRRIALQDTTLADSDPFLYQRGNAFYSPRWSIDGTKLAYASGPLGGDLNVSAGTARTNHAPAMTAGSYADNDQLATCSLFQRTLSASDADGDAITYELLYKPGGMTIAGGNLLKWIPNSSQVGEFYVTLRAKDGNGGVDQKVMRFVVGDYPEICSCPRYPYCYPAGAQPVTENADIPVAFGLSQNQPNPFHEPTMIRFALPSSSHVRLEIFDLLGRRVRTLVDADLPAAFHSRQWDLRTDHGDLVRPGIYMYRMIAGEFRDQKKMLLVP